QQPIVTRTAQNRVVSSAAIHGVIAGAGTDHVIAAHPIDDVIPAQAHNDIIALNAHQHVIARGPADGWKLATASAKDDVAFAAIGSSSGISPECAEYHVGQPIVVEVSGGETDAEVIGSGNAVEGNVWVGSQIDGPGAQGPEDDVRFPAFVS